MTDKYPKININTDMLKNIDVSKFQDLSQSITNTQARLNEQFSAMAALNNAKYQREIESHEALLKIAENTQGIGELVSLVREGNKINHNTFKLIQQLQTIMTAESEEEGNTILREVIDTANQANEAFETIQTLIGYGKMLINLIFQSNG